MPRGVYYRSKKAAGDDVVDDVKPVADLPVVAEVKPIVKSAEIDRSNLDEALEDIVLPMHVQLVHDNSGSVTVTNGAYAESIHLTSDANIIRRLVLRVSGLHG